jgi:trimethylamine---corrinoid protein Co-methyltransferase
VRIMQPKISLLTDELVKQILDEAFQLLIKPGIKVQSPQAMQLLEEAGASIDKDAEVAHIPEKIVYQALETVPHEFLLYDRHGNPKITYGGDAVHFDPGSSGVHILDPETGNHRPSYTNDLVRIVKLTEMLSQFDAQSTAVICNEIPKPISDLYRLYLVLLYSTKPIITGAFAIPTLQVMVDMLALFAGNREKLAKKPQAVFDVCPSPPLIWSNFGAQNLIDLARAGVPAQMVSMPLAGATAPVTLVGSVVQHAAECLSGITIHQLAKPGSPIVWGGAPAIFDMRKGTTPMGAIETAMIDASYAQVGKFLGLPTHTYLCASDAKVIDAQAGLESGISATIGALAGVNMISGAGMLDFLACFSLEKLVIDAEIVSMTKRLLSGIHTPTETLATAMFEGINFKGDFLKQKVTRELFSQEQYLPSKVLDRDSIRGWHQDGSLDSLSRARSQVKLLLDQYETPELPEHQIKELKNLVNKHAKDAGLDSLPVLEH